MSQHDGTIDNGTGAVVRADINAALGAIFTQHAGATAPSPTFAWQPWGDTSTGTLKIRNPSNTGWIVQAVIDEANGVIAPVPSRDMAITATGTTVADAAPINQQRNFITAGAADTGIQWAGASGMEFAVVNKTASAKVLYAADGGSVDGGTVDAGVTIPAGATMWCIEEGGDLWTL